MLDDDYARLRLQALEQAVGSTLSPLTDSAGLLGAWDMRFGGPVGSDEIEGLEDGGFSEERRLAFRAADGRVVLSNDDTSVIEVLTRPGEADAA